ncbi:unnamed protein product [Sphagnum compactum]
MIVTLNLMVWIQTCVVVYMCTTAWWVLLHRLKQRHYKGPKSWPLLGCLLEQAAHFDDMHDWLLDYFKDLLTYSVPMVNFNNTFTVDPANVEWILKTNFNNYPKGELIKERFEDVMGHGIFIVDGEQWKHQRKVATVEFSSSKLRDFSVHAYRSGALKLVQVLAIAAKNHEIVDLQDLFMRLTLDSICKIGFGVEIGCLSPSLPEVPFAKAFDECNRLVIRRYIDIFWKIKRALNIGTEAQLRKNIQVMDSFLYKVIETRRADVDAAKALHQSEVRNDILSRFMAKDLACDGEVYDDKKLRDVCINFIVAGRDTTAVTLSWFFSELCKHPEVVNNILAEVSEVFHKEQESVQNGKQNKTNCNGISFQGLGDQILEFAQRLNYQNLAKLHYLHAALTEALRLYPAVPLETKAAVNDDVFPDGTVIKGGNFVSFAPYAMGRLECLWGPDALEFKPERWLKDGVFQPESPYKLTAFQAGPRMCLGKDSAYLQMKMTTLLLLQFFNFELVKGQNLNYSMMVILSIAGGMKAHITQKTI